MKYYLSDTENIGNQWSQFIHELSAGDHMIMFHTETNCHQSITLDQLSNMTNFGKIKLYGVPCARGENDALRAENEELKRINQQLKELHELSDADIKTLLNRAHSLETFAGMMNIMNRLP